MATKKDNKKGKPNKAPKKSEVTSAQKLLELYATAQAPTGPLVTSVKIFAPFSGFVRAYLIANQYSEASKHHVAEMAFHFRKEAFKRFGHDTIETFELAQLLKPKQDISRPGRLDAVSHIMGYPARRHRLGDEQLDAADQIKKIWKALGKGIDGSGGRDLSRTGGSGRALHPIDTMDEELYVHYRKVYVPWHNQAARLQIGRKWNSEPVSIAAIVYNILIGDIYPEQVDAGYKLVKGAALHCLQQALLCYDCPQRMRAAIAPPKTPAPPASEPALPVSKAAGLIPPAKG